MAGKMAAAELKHDNVSCYETVKKNASAITLHREIECYQFRLLDLFYYLTSVSFFFIDIATDSIVFIKYFLQGQFVWGCFALSFTILPAGIIQIFSLRWYHSDGSIKNIHWLLHFLFLGVLHRYLILLYSTIHSLRSKRFMKDKNWVYRQESDICMLHLFESFMGAAPQLILQLYIMAVLRYIPLWTSLSAIVSFCSLSWAIGTYTKAMQKINPDNNEATWIVLILQGLWRAGMLISRIAVLVLTAVCLRQWSLLFLGFHWLFMTIWVLLQNTNFCPTIWEERIYNCIIGLIYCFDFFNLRIGKSRYRVFIFYSIIVIENIVFLVVFVLYFKDIIKTEKIIIMTSFIIGGMMIGLMSMLFYYGKFHPSKVGNITEIGDKKSEIVTNKAVTPRSFKQYYPNSFTASSCSIDRSQRTTSEEITTDKQYLLTNIVQNSECTENGVINQTCQIENDSPSTAAVCVVSECESAHNNVSKDENPSSNILPSNAFTIADNTCEYLEIHDDHNNSNEKDIHRQKRRGICLPTIHALDIDKDVSTKDSNDSCLPLQKRRGICFSNQLILEMESNDQGKVITNRNLILDISTKRNELENCSLSNICKDLNSITMLRDRMEIPTIFNESCEKTEETEKLTKELQQRDETMSCVTSIHDYENVCPLGVARPPWCIRSWKGYTDIETYIHDDSVVRDRRRDTLTSTTTGTTYSSEFSDTTCASSILRGILKQDDYLDTLTYDLIDSRELKTAYSEDISAKRIADVDEQNSILYIAKPVVIDDKGGMFALDTILEEHDEMATEEKFEYDQSNCDSVSTLVNTIDQIRKYTAENSPRHVYHTTGSQWEDFDPKNLIKKAQLTKALFKTDLKDPVTCSRNYINCLEESESIIREKDEIDTIKDLVKYCTIESIKKTPLIDAILSDSPILGNKTKLQKQGFISSRKDEADSKENDLYVEMSPLVPVENVKIVHNNLSNTVSPNITSVNSNSADTKRLDTSTSYISTQVKSNSDNTEKLEPICDKVRKKPINYPKRKFSLLKEKFESKSQLVYVVTPNKAIKIGQSTASPEIETSKKNVSVILKKSADYIKYDKENLAPIASFKVCYEKNTSNDKSHSNRENIDLIYENDKSLCNNDLNLKERRHIFLEQVLSPPKLLTWNKKKSFSGSTVKKI
ncbi:uncharacterized protein LOC100578388 isoform X2 [Apis mellifera]|uniref:XK-related protein n=3 Tax=Apis mellifera TaxID=7460 RepID=A0A7M7H485_APIME|nr:uncharacterized protein LOC100578388 isoform X2 [Apis mellifera]|eukprot:XP_006570466.2 uncharacterized protein LOC100578388 isoform X2 [Apis mellifera]